MTNDVVRRQARPRSSDYAMSRDVMHGILQDIHTPPFLAYLCTLKTVSSTGDLRHDESVSGCTGREVQRCAVVTTITRPFVL